MLEGVDLTVDYFKPKGKECHMCGAKTKKLFVVLDPERFPENDCHNRDHHWDVCKCCKEEINQGVLDAYRYVLQTSEPPSGEAS